MAMTRQAWIFVVMPPVALALFVVVARPAQWDPLHIAGLVLTVVGIGLLTVARVQLGASFSVTPQARVLVTTGLYRKIRHPVYVFGAIGVAGGMLYLGRPKLLGVLVALIPLQLWRMRAEGKKLEEKFGDQYYAWKRTTWF